MKPTMLLVFAVALSTIACADRQVPAVSAPRTTAAAVPHDSPDCHFVAGGKCFTHAADACAIAGCEMDACVMAEVHPSIVTCS